jgi:hypothetical protein
MKFLVPTFVDRGVSRGQRGGSPMVINLSFLDRKILGTLFIFIKIIVFVECGIARLQHAKFVLSVG